MGRFLEIINALHLMHGVVLLVVGCIGVIGTFAIGRHIEEEAIGGWIRQAELDAAIATTTAQAWLAQSETIINGLSLGFRGAEKTDPETFNNLVAAAADWNSEFTLDAVALVERVQRPQRRQFTQALGRALSDASDPAKSVPDAFVYMVVVNSTESSGPLRISVDLLTKAEMAIVATTARRVPGRAILGPAFSAGDKRLYSLVGVGLTGEHRNSIVVGLVDLSEIIKDIVSNYVPLGLKLRISERDNEARATTKLRPIYGSLKAEKGTAHTVTIRVTRGQARWNYHWDVTPAYLGGAPTANATMVQIGGLIITVLVVYSISLLSIQNALIKSRVRAQTAELQSSQAQLRQSHDKLEELIDQRTNELKAALVSEREMKRQAEEANRAKSSFLASMSHELRTPLNAILGFSDMMRTEIMGPLENERYRQYADNIFESGALLVNLIDDVLDLSKIEAGKFEFLEDALDIRPQIEVSFRQLSTLAKVSGKQLKADLAPDLPALRGDPRALIQVLNNLVSNAIKFTPDCGEITVAAKLDTVGRIIISIQDNGIGMSPEDIARAQQPFEQVDQPYRRKYEGTGLGLHLCARIMDLFGGQLQIDSELGCGTTVTLEFPAERSVPHG